MAIHIGRREFVTLLGGAAAWPFAARAQRSAMPVIGFLNGGSPNAFGHLAVRAFTQGLSAQGYIEGRSIKIEYRWADGQYDRLPALAADLVRRQVTVIAAIGGPAIALAAKRTTTTVPIVFQIGGDPVDLGLVTSLSRPGGNVTGVTSMNLDLASKRLELMHDMLPAATSIALLVNSTNSMNVESETTELKKAAQALGLELHIVAASTERDFDTVFAALRQLRVGGLLLGMDQLFTGGDGKLSALAIRDAVPAIGAYREFPAAGGLMSYGAVLAEEWRLAGVYVGRVVRGEKPADLPVQRSTSFELVINLRTAKVLGLEVPPTLLARANDVIE